MQLELSEAQRKVDANTFEPYMEYKLKISHEFIQDLEAIRKAEGGTEMHEFLGEAVADALVKANKSLQQGAIFKLTPV